MLNLTTKTECNTVLNNSNLGLINLALYMDRVFYPVFNTSIKLTLILSY